MERPKKSLSDPQYAAFAWARYRMILRWMLFAALLVSTAALFWLDSVAVTLNWSLFVAVLGGIGGSIFLAGALMGLIFLSSGSGHDEETLNFSEDEK